MLQIVRCCQLKKLSYMTRKKKQTAATIRFISQFPRLLWNEILLKYKWRHLIIMLVSTYVVIDNLIFIWVKIAIYKCIFYLKVIEYHLL